MAYPFFSLAKSRRTTPIDFQGGGVTIRVEAVPEHGMATIWDADVLIWAASQLVEARDAGLPTSRLMAATPYEILTFIGRGTSLRDYQRLKAALDRLQSTTVLTSLHQRSERRLHRFSWINEWMDRADAQGRPEGIELILPDWFYRAILEGALVLTIDKAYFALTGGLERWLYRLVRKHGGRQRVRLAVRSPPPPCEVRQPRRRSSASPSSCATSSAASRCPATPCPSRSRPAAACCWRSSRPVENPATDSCHQEPASIVPSGTAPSCYQEPKSGLSHGHISQIGAPNLDSNLKRSNFRGPGLWKTPPRSRLNRVQGAFEKAADPSTLPEHPCSRGPVSATSRPVPPKPEGTS